MTATPTPPSPPPSPRKRSRFRRGFAVFLHRTGSHTFGVFHHLLNLGLLALIIAITSVLLRDDLPVPDFLRTRLERELAARGFAVTVGHAEIDPTAKILAEDVTLAPARFGGPMFSAGRMLVEFDRLKLLAGRVELVALDAEDVRIICPASLSPTGEAQTLVEIAAVRVTQHAGVWRVPGLVATIGPLRFTARGLYNTNPLAPAETAPAPPPDLNALLDQFAHLAPRAVRELARLDPFEEPRLQIVFAGGRDRPVSVDVSLNVAAWRDPKIGEAHGISARTRVTLGATPAAPVRLTTRVERFARPDGLAADGLDLDAEWLSPPTAKSFLPWQVHLAAAQVVHPKGKVTAPVVAVFPLAYPLVDVEAAVLLEGERLALTAEGDLRQRSGIVQVRGSAGRTWLTRVSEVLGRDVSYYATIDTPPDFSARVTIAPDAKWQSIDFRLLAPPLVARKVPLDRARVRGRVLPGGLHIDQLECARGDESVRGTYESDFQGRDYRFRLTGAMRPAAIAPWFGPWWGRFWNDYQFNGPPPTFDIDQHGNWLRPEPIILTGSGRAEKVTIRGIAADAVRTRIHLRPNYYDLFDATVLRPEGRLDGEIQWRNVRGDPLPVWQHFAFSSNADLVELARIFGPGGEALLAPYRYTTPPDVTLVGTVTRADQKYDVDLELSLNTGDEFRYLDFPLSWLTTRALIHNRYVVLPEFHAGYANGVLTGEATIDAGQLGFSAQLAHADFDLAMKIYSDFVDRNFPSPPETAEPGSIAREDYGGKLTLALTAKGPITNLKGFEGTGTVELTEADLYQLNVIGLFSDLTGIGSLGFKHARGPFEVRRDILYFPDLRVTGDTARLDASGTYSLQDRSIDFRVRMKPLSESSGLITKGLGWLFNDVIKAFFEARLTGTLRNPKRSMTILPQRAPEEPPPMTEPAPAAETPAATAPVPATPAPPNTPP